MHDLLMWLVPWLGGYIFNDLVRWVKDRRAWHVCPISTCEFRMKSNNPEVLRACMTRHILDQHYEQTSI